MSKICQICQTGHVRSQLIARGVSEEVASRVEAYFVIDEDGKIFSEVMTMGYPCASRNGISRKITIIRGMFEGGIAATLRNCEELSHFLEYGMRGTPANEQVPLPAWVHDNTQFPQKICLEKGSEALAVH